MDSTGWRAEPRLLRVCGAGSLIDLKNEQDLNKYSTLGSAACVRNGHFKLRFCRPHKVFSLLWVCFGETVLSTSQQQLDQLYLLGSITDGSEGPGATYVQEDPRQGLAKKE